MRAPVNSFEFHRCRRTPQVEYLTLSLYHALLIRSTQLVFIDEWSLKYFGEKFGSKNVVYAKVHLDETTPHMHLGIVPLTSDGRLSAKDVFNRSVLRSVQSELPVFLKSKGFDVKRGRKDETRK